MNNLFYLSHHSIVQSTNGQASKNDPFPSKKNVYRNLQAQLYWMFHQKNSSSDDEDQEFDYKFKKIQYHGTPFDSDNNDSLNEDSESPQESKRESKLNKKSHSHKEDDPESKSKAIKKNRESAKISRLRKKQYQVMLQQTVEELQRDISQKKTSIKSITDRIMAKFQATNKDKHKYLVEKLILSKKLLAISQEVKRLKQVEEERQQNHNSEPISETVKVEEGQPQPNSPLDLGKSLNTLKEEHTKATKTRKKKGEALNQEEKIKHQTLIAEKEALLQMTIKTYMYEFGVKGCLRSDIIERCKSEWLQTVKELTPHPGPQIQSCISRMKSCLQRLESKTKVLDYHLRQLKDRVKDKYVVQFLLDREYFVNKSADTIYKNSQLKNCHC